MKLLVLDNYDSFTYNLVHLLRSLGVAQLEVHRNDRISLADVNNYTHIVLSPGPGIPNEAGIMPELVKNYAASKKILGVCLGHQCIGEVFGAELENLGSPIHGKGIMTKVINPQDPLFKGLPNEFISGRYHSWVVRKDNLPKDILISAVDADGNIMGLRHREFDVCGVQFHPESVLTEYGSELMRNWIG